MIVAHRGASKDAPENTLPAFHLAWEQGADAIEGDFQLSKDGQMVCIHDEDTERVAGIKLMVKDASLSDLRRLDVGAYRGAKYLGTIIPTLAEVFATVPDQKKIYIEVKSDESIVPNLLKEIRQSRLKEEQVTIISLNPKVISALKTVAPRFKAFWLSEFRKDESGEWIPSLQTVLTTLREIKADGLGASKDINDEAFVRQIQNAGFEFHVWTVDDVKTARRFLKWGAQSITTNVPDHLRKHLASIG